MGDRYDDVSEFERICSSADLGDRITYKNLPNAKLTTKIDNVVSCLVTSDHKIPVGNMLFWDWEDNLVPTRQNVDVLLNKIRANRTIKRPSVRSKISTE